MRFALLCLLAFALGFSAVTMAQTHRLPRPPSVHVADVWDGCWGRHHEIVSVFGKECR